MNRNLEHDQEFLGFESYGATGRDYIEQAGKDAASAYHKGRICSEMWEPSYANVEGEPFPFDEEKLWDGMIARNACEFLASRDADRPFAMYVGFRAPHTPWRAPKRFHEQYDPDDVGPLPDYTSPPPRDIPRRLIERHHYFDIPFYSEAMVRRSIAAYHAFVAYMDDCVGQVLAKLDELNLRDDTLVVYASDHGEQLYRHGLTEKHTFYEDSIRVPLILAGPGVPRGRRVEALASLMDVMPTVLAMADVEQPGFVEGCDLRPGFEGRAVRDHVLAEYYHTLDPCRMVRDGRYKYIHTEEDVCELYDLAADPDERVNLAWRPGHRERVERMDQLALDGWEIPDLPIHAPWFDLHERKQRQLLRGDPILDVRPGPE